MVLFYVPCESDKQATHIAQELLKESLVGCANVWPCQSFYKENGRIQNGNEFILLIKTEKKLADAVKNRIKELHSYNIPAILKIDACPNRAYKEWLLGELSNDSRTGPA
jgi:periplasmic divalent cation tolerance protein